MSTRSALSEARRIVVKLGTRVLTGGGDGIDRARVAEVAAAVARWRREGREALLVSSGAVGLGRRALGFEDAPRLLEERQACAAVGQTRLMAVYQDELERHGLVAGQVLLTEGDFDDRVRYLNLRSALAALLARGVVPVINENDVVSTEELAFDEAESRPVFGDNDRLSALVATKLGAQLLVLLTDVDGLFDRDPGDPERRLVPRVEDVDSVEVPDARSPGWGRGGMKSKVEACAVAARGGCHVVIASGLASGVLEAIGRGADVGTWFPAQAALAARRRWIAFAAAPRGVLHLDEGAVRAICERGASLLAPGVRRIDGEFRRGDVVELRDPAGALVGRGIVFCDAAVARAWRELGRPAHVRNHDALIHRDHLVLEDRR